MKPASKRSGPRTLAHHDFSDNANVMFSAFYDIIAKVTAAQRFIALALFAAFGKCHERYGCVTFREICGVCPAT
jgi:hypothetical protein